MFLYYARFKQSTNNHIIDFVSNNKNHPKGRWKSRHENQHYQCYTMVELHDCIINKVYAPSIYSR